MFRLINSLHNHNQQQNVGNSQTSEVGLLHTQVNFWLMVNFGIGGNSAQADYVLFRLSGQSSSHHWVLAFQKGWGDPVEDTECRAKTKLNQDILKNWRNLYYLQQVRRVFLLGTYTCSGRHIRCVCIPEHALSKVKVQDRKGNRHLMACLAQDHRAHIWNSKMVDMNISGHAQFSPKSFTWAKRKAPENVPWSRNQPVLLPASLHG